MLANNVVAFAGAALMGFSKMAGSYEMLIVGRLVIGINCGRYMYYFIRRINYSAVSMFNL